MVKDLKPGEDLVLTEKKTTKERRITLNQDCMILFKICFSHLKESEKTIPSYLTAGKETLNR
jgi:hypothetical protein